jgi:hypothetical protein
VTDELEQQLRAMLQRRVADLPDSYDVAPASLARARRRRATKLGALATALVVVVAGTVAGVANAVDRSDGAHYVSAGGEERVTVPTVACPVGYDGAPGTPHPAPSTAPREVTVTGADALVSYAATTDDRYVVLGPKGWSCNTMFSTDEPDGMALSPEPPLDNPIPGAITVMNDFLWHRGAGSTLACAASDDRSVTQYVEQHFPEARPCPRSGRTITRVDEHTETFVDDDGTRGASWIVVPSGSDDGEVSVLTCQPTAGLTGAQCDTIVADFVARLTRSSPPVTTVPETSGPTVPRTHVETTICPTAYHAVNSNPLPAPSTAPRGIAAGDATFVPLLWSYAAAPPEKFVVLGPRKGTCVLEIAADGSARMTVTSPLQRASRRDGQITVEDDWLWHGRVGTSLACSVFDDASVAQLAAQFGAEPCPRAGRTVTRLDSQTATFVDLDGKRGTARMVLPSAKGDDGRITVLTCRPSEEVTAEMCDTIVADWAARVRDQSAAPASTVPRFGCADSGTEGQYPPGTFATPGAGDRTLYPGLASFSSDVDGAAVNAVLGPRSWTCRLEDPDTKPTITVFDPARGSGPDGRSAPILLDVHLLWGNRPDAVAACAVFDDPAIEAYVAPRFAIRCPETSGFAVTRVGSHAARFIGPDGTLGAAWYRLPSSDDADDGRLFVLTCRPTAGLSREQCDTITADYAARTEAWVEPR